MKKIFTSLLLAFFISFAFYFPNVYANNMVNDTTNATKNVIDSAGNAVEDTANRCNWCD